MVNPDRRLGCALLSEGANAFGQIRQFKSEGREPSGESQAPCPSEERL
jgi:hypothetical protein